MTKKKAELKALLASLVVIAFFFTAAALVNRHLRFTDTTWVEPPPDRQTKLDPRLYKIMSFGNVPVMIEWLWLRALADPTITPVPPGRHASIFFDLDLITDLDHAFYEPYFGGANILAVIRRDITGARLLLEKADRFIRLELPHLPASFQSRFWRSRWNIYILMGYLQLFELDNMPAAAKAFIQASAIQGAPDSLERLSNRLRQPGGEYEVGLRLLNFLVKGTQDDRIKDRLVKKRRNLFLAQYLFETNRSFTSFLERIPRYKASQVITKVQMQAYWKDYIKESRLPAKDPLGGDIYLDTEGKVRSTTPYEPVFGLR